MASSNGLRLTAYGLRVVRVVVQDPAATVAVNDLAAGFEHRFVDDAKDLAVPGQKASFGVIKAALAELRRACAPEGEVAVAPVEGGGPEILVAPRGRDAVFSPDGKTLYVANALNNDVAVIQLGAKQGGHRPDPGRHHCAAPHPVAAMFQRIGAGDRRAAVDASGLPPWPAP